MVDGCPIPVVTTQFPNLNLNPDLNLILPAIRSPPQQQPEKNRRRRDPDSPEIVIRLPAKRWTQNPLHRDGVSLHRPPLPLQIGYLLRARVHHSARPDKLDNAPQFVAVEPRPVLAAHVHDDVRAMREIHPVHQLPAHRTRDVVDVLSPCPPSSGFATGPAVPSTADCFSRSSQILCSASASAQIPSQRGHSRKGLPPMTTAFISTRQRGHNSGLASGDFRPDPPSRRNANKTSSPRTSSQSTTGRPPWPGARRNGRTAWPRRDRRAAHRAIQCFSRHRDFLSLFTHSTFTIHPPGHYILRPNLYFPEWPRRKEYSQN